MLFNSFIFLIFLIIIVPIFLKLSGRWKKYFLLISSYIFYGYWDWRFLFLLLISTLVDFIIGQKIYKEQKAKKKKILLFVSLLVNLGILGTFKYFNFFVDSFQTAFETNLDFLHLNILLPVGISFYTFQTLSYTIDIYRKKLEPTKSFIDFAIFVSFFPQLVAGPIERAINLLPQIKHIKPPSKIQIKEGITLIIYGLFKKVMIGDASGKYVDYIFGQSELYNSTELVFALILFSIQIYADFSGYSNIARGTAKLLGFELMKNFEQPYLSTNITEFWRRWHISLSSWLKDYLYIPLGGNRLGKFRTYINLMLTMLIGGLWHGANWTFVIWGGLHGIYLAVHRLILNRNKTSKQITNKIIKSIILITKIVSTYTLVLLTWLFFRIPNFDEGISFFVKIANWEWSEYTGRLITIAFTFLFTTIIFDILENNTHTHTFILNLKNTAIRNAILFSLFTSTLMYMFQGKPMPFVYFQF